MPSFLEDIRPFYGTGEKNNAGQTLEEFLESYNPDKYRTPGCTTDAVIFSYREKSDMEKLRLKVLLVKRSNHPSIGYWALPGGFVNMKENLEETAKRELQEETGVSGVRMEQIATYGDYTRDPRTRVITTAYMALVKESDVTVQAGDDAADAAWCEIEMRCLTDNECRETSGAAEPEKTELYEIHLKNKAKALDITALVEHKISGNLIREERYTVKEPGILAVDHAAILAQAFSILKKRLEKSKSSVK